MADSVKRRIPSAAVAGFRRAGGRRPEHETGDGKGAGDITGSHNPVYVNPANFAKYPLCKPNRVGNQANFAKWLLCKPAWGLYTRRSSSGSRTGSVGAVLQLPFKAWHGMETTNPTPRRFPCYIQYRWLPNMTSRTNDGLRTAGSPV